MLAKTALLRYNNYSDKERVIICVLKGILGVCFSVKSAHTECCYSSREVNCNNTLFLYFVLLSCCRGEICKIYALAGVHYNIRLRYGQLCRNINSAHTVIIYNQSLRSYSVNLFCQIYHYLLNQFGKHTLSTLAQR